MTSANTNDNPIVLSCPMSCNVVGDVRCMVQCNGIPVPVPGARFPGSQIPVPGSRFPVLRRYTAGKAAASAPGSG
jgi:hypothetical protein